MEVTRSFIRSWIALPDFKAVFEANQKTEWRETIVKRLRRWVVEKGSTGQILLGALGVGFENWTSYHFQFSTTSVMLLL